MAALSCTVRGCGLPLSRVGGSFACATGHSFDVARAGHVNLLQPQDKRSPAPGDAAETVAARRRVVRAGLLADLHDAILDVLSAAPIGRDSCVLDVGCGEGTLLAAVNDRLGAEAHGVDLSTAAVEAAARAHPACQWVVANADRGLPFAPGSFDAALSVDSRLPSAELLRVLAPRGLLVVAVPAPDDLAELREAVQGAAATKDRMARALAELSPSFEVVGRTSIRERRRLEPPALRDLLAASYRGARLREKALAGELEPLDVTLAHDLACLRVRSVSE